MSIRTQGSTPGMLCADLATSKTMTSSTLFMDVGSAYCLAFKSLQSTTILSICRMLRQIESRFALRPSADEWKSSCLQTGIRSISWDLLSNTSKFLRTKLSAPFRQATTRPRHRQFPSTPNRDILLFFFSEEIVFISFHVTAQRAFFCTDSSSLRRRCVRPQSSSYFLQKCIRSSLEDSKGSFKFTKQLMNWLRELKIMFQARTLDIFKVCGLALLSVLEAPAVADPELIWFPIRLSVFLSLPPLESVEVALFASVF